MNIYQHLLMDHYHNSQHRGTLATADFSSGVVNPSCGDSISFQGTVKDNILVDVKFTGSGCVISQAAASLLSERVLRKSLDEILGLTKDTMLELIGMPVGPTRLRCALLPLEALQQGIKAYSKQG